MSAAPSPRSCRRVRRLWKPGGRIWPATTCSCSSAAAKSLLHCLSCHCARHSICLTLYWLTASDEFTVFLVLGCLLSEDVCGVDVRRHKQDICIKWSVPNGSRLSKHIYFGHCVYSVLWVQSDSVSNVVLLPSLHAALDSFLSVIFDHVLEEEAALLLNNKLEVLQPTAVSPHFLFRRWAASPKSEGDNGRERFFTAALVTACPFFSFHLCLYYVWLHVVQESLFQRCIQRS